MFEYELQYAFHSFHSRIHHCVCVKTNNDFVEHSRNGTITLIKMDEILAEFELHLKALNNVTENLRKEIDKRLNVEKNAEPTI